MPSFSFRKILAKNAVTITLDWRMAEQSDGAMNIRPKRKNTIENSPVKPLRNSKRRVPLKPNISMPFNRITIKLKIPLIINNKLRRRSLYLSF